jgi:DNA-binding SARP family transcriptional activator
VGHSGFPDLDETLTPQAAGRIELCGALAVELGGRRLEAELRGRQGKLCFAYLALNRDRAVSRGELIDALWPDSPPALPSSALATLLSRIRAALGPEVVEGRSELRLRLPPDTRVDTEVAAAALDRAESALADGDPRGAWGPANLALTIARRELLPGFDAPWIEQGRRELEETALRALECIARIGLALGGSELGPAERASRELIERAPYRESAYGLLMQAQAAGGNVAEALAVYERVRSLVAEELGTVPGPALQALHARLLRGEPVAPAAEERSRIPLLPDALALPGRAAFVGRGAEISRLRELWNATQQGGRGLALVAGEAGIGKTRLAGEFGRLLAEEGATVLYGRCDAEPLAPYQPFVEALGHYVAHAPPARLERQAAGDAGELARLLPRLGERLPSVPAPPSGEPEAERFRLFEAVARLLRRVAAGPGLLLLLDDLQWSDRPTLLLLRHVLRTPDHSPLLIVGTYRQEPDLSYALAETISELRREHLLHRLELEGLSEPETGYLIETRGGSGLPASLTHAIYATTGGNPYFAEEVTRHVRDLGPDPGLPLEQIGLPESVRDVIGRRLARASEDTRDVLQIAAVAGPEFVTETLDRVAKLSGDRLLRALEQARDFGLVVELRDQSGRYAFSHALVRSVLLADLSQGRRRLLHRQIAEELEETARDAPATHLGALAYHCFEAIPEIEPMVAMEHCARVGDMATSLLAFEEAEKHYVRALDALALAAHGDDERECDLHLALGTAQMRGGDIPGAKRTFLGAVELARRLGDPERLARASLGYGVTELGTMGQTSGAVDQHLVRLLNEALAELPEEEGELAARVRARLAVELYYSPGTLERRDSLSERAIAIARELDDSATLGFTLAARRYALGGPRNLVARLEASVAAAQLAASAHDPQLAVHAHAWLLVDQLEQGDMAGVEAQMAEHARLARELRQPFHLRWAKLFAAMLATLRGDFAEGERLAERALELGRRVHEENALMGYAVQLFTVRLAQGRLAELEPVVGAFLERYPGVAAWRAALALIYAELEREDDARRELRRVARVGFDRIPEDMNWLIAMYLLARSCALLHDAENAEPLYEMLEPCARRNVVVGYGLACMGSCSRPLGLLALARDDVPEACRHFDDALAANTAAGARPEIAHVQYEYARALLARAAVADRERATALLDESRSTAHELGMKSLKRRVDSVRAVALA